jgi:hypothetical protein
LKRILTKPNSCDICDMRSVCEQSGPILANSDLQAYGPCHRRDGTAGTPELLPQITQPGLGTTSDDYGPAATCRSMNLASAAGARATRMSQLWAGDAAGAWRKRTRATPCDVTNDYATAGSGPTRQSVARDSESIASQLDAACAGYLLF